MNLVIDESTDSESKELFDLFFAMYNDVRLNANGEKLSELAAGETFEMTYTLTVGFVNTYNEIETIVPVIVTLIVIDTTPAIVEVEEELDADSTQNGIGFIIDEG